MTTSEDSARSQAALLEANPPPSPFEFLRDYFAKHAEYWRTVGQDPHGIATALYTMHMELQAACEEVLKQ